MKKEFIEYTSQYISAKTIKGEVEFLLFYRRLIIKLMIVFFLVNLCSLSFLLFAHDLFVYLAQGTVSYLSVTFYGAFFFLFSGTLYYFLREEMFIKESLKKIHQLKNIISVA